VLCSRTWQVCSCHSHTMM